LFTGFSLPAPSQQFPIVPVSATEPSVSQSLADQRLPGTISGTVLDGTGAVVIGAHVILTREDPSAQQEVVSGDYGQYSFAKVAPGAFEIRVAAAGFAGQTTSGILHSGETYLVPRITLGLPALENEVEVRFSRTEVAEEQIKAQEKQRLLGVVPNFYVTYIPNAVPLTAKQKVELGWKATVDPVTLVLTLAGSGAEQAENDFSGYGQGVQGYAKRFGAGYADNVTSTLIGSAFLPALLKQDPRYFYKGTGSTRSRVLYAIANAVICKGDNQRWQPNYSAILGGLASGGISNLYYPPQDRGAALVFETTLIGTGETAVFNVFQEFFARRLTPHTGARH
jgi:hypothetical protein